MVQTHGYAAKKNQGSLRRLPILFFLLLVFVVQQVNGQQFSDERPAPNAINAKDLADTETKWMKKKLKLKKEQVIAVREINTKYAGQLLDEIKKETNKQEEDKKKQRLAELEKSKDKELEAVLTADQMKRYRAHRGEIKEAMEEAGNRRMPPPPGREF